MNSGIPSAFLAAVVCTSVCIAISLRTPRRPLGQSLAAFSLALALWHGASLVMRIAGTAPGSLQTAVALFLPTTAAVFFSQLLGWQGQLWQRQLQAIAAGTAIFLGLTASPWGQTFAARSASTVFVLLALTLPLYKIYLAQQAAHKPYERKRLGLLFYGGATALVWGGVGLLPSADLLGAAGHLVVSAYVYFLYQSVRARRLVDFAELVGQAAVLATLTLLLATLHTLLGLLVGADRPGVWLFNTMVTGFVVLIVFDQIRPWVEKGAARLLWRRTSALKDSLAALAHRLATVLDVENMATQTLHALMQSGRVSSAAIYIQEAGSDRWLRQDPTPTEMALDTSTPGEHNAHPHATQPFPDELKPTQHGALLARLGERPILAEALVHAQTRNVAMLEDGDAVQAGKAVLEVMQHLGAHVCIPLRWGKRTVGLLALASNAAAAAYSREELAALSKVAHNCAAVVVQSQAYRKQQEQIRMAAVGQLAAGLAHEIRNPLGALKGAAQCLDFEGNPSEGYELVAVIEEEVQRLDRVVGQFLEYARPLQPHAPKAASAAQAIQATKRLLATHPKAANRSIQTKIATQLDAVSMDGEHLRQVLLNLSLNGLEAAGPTGEVSICAQPALGGVRIDVSDTGPGIPAEVRQTLFEPFVTTKVGGTGLGLAICQRWVAHAGGRLTVTSSASAPSSLQEKGACFTLWLPTALPSP